MIKTVILYLTLIMLIKLTYDWILNERIKLWHIFQIYFDYKNTHFSSFWIKCGFIWDSAYHCCTVTTYAIDINNFDQFSSVIHVQGKVTELHGIEHLIKFYQECTLFLLFWEFIIISCKYDVFMTKLQVFISRKLAVNKTAYGTLSAWPVHLPEYRYYIYFSKISSIVYFLL